MIELSTLSLDELYEAWQRELVQVRHKPDPALIASLESAARTQGEDLINRLRQQKQTLLAFGPQSHFKKNQPRGKDGRWIEIGGLINLLGYTFKNKQTGKDVKLDNRRGKVLGWDPPDKDGNQKVRVSLLDDKGNQSMILGDVKPSQLEQAPEKARLNAPYADKPNAPEAKQAHDAPEGGAPSAPEGGAPEAKAPEAAKPKKKGRYADHPDLQERFDKAQKDYGAESSDTTTFEMGSDAKAKYNKELDAIDAELAKREAESGTPKAPPGTFDLPKPQEWDVSAEPDTSTEFKGIVNPQPDTSKFDPAEWDVPAPAKSIKNLLNNAAVKPDSFEPQVRDRIADPTTSDEDLQQVIGHDTGGKYFDDVLKRDDLSGKSLNMMATRTNSVTPAQAQAILDHPNAGDMAAFRRTSMQTLAGPGAPEAPAAPSPDVPEANAPDVGVPSKTSTEMADAGASVQGGEVVGPEEDFHGSNVKLLDGTSPKVGTRVVSVKDGKAGTIVKYDKSENYAKVQFDGDDKVYGRSKKTLKGEENSTPSEKNKDAPVVPEAGAPDGEGVTLEQADANAPEPGLEPTPAPPGPLHPSVTGEKVATPPPIVPGKKTDKFNPAVERTKVEDYLSDPAPGKPAIKIRDKRFVSGGKGKHYTQDKGQQITLNDQQFLDYAETGNLPEPTSQLIKPGGDVGLKTKPSSMADSYKMTPTPQLKAIYDGSPKWQQNLIEKELQSRGEKPDAYPPPPPKFAGTKVTPGTKEDVYKALSIPQLQQMWAGAPDDQKTLIQNEIWSRKQTGGGKDTVTPNVLKGLDNVPAGTTLSQNDRNKIQDQLNMMLQDSGNTAENEIGAPDAFEFADELKNQPGESSILVKPSSGYEMMVPRGLARLLAFTDPETGKYNPPTTERQIVQGPPPLA